MTNGVVEVERDGKVGIHAYRSKQKNCARTKLVCGKQIENLHVTYTEVIQRESVTARVLCVQGRGLLSLDRALIVAP